MGMNREKQAIDYVNALRAYEKAADPIIEFDRMLTQWKNQLLSGNLLKILKICGNNLILLEKRLTHEDLRSFH
jgi:hypothetical protein